LIFTQVESDFKRHPVGLMQAEMLSFLNSHWFPKEKKPYRKVVFKIILCFQESNFLAKIQI